METVSLASVMSTQTEQQTCYLEISKETQNFFTIKELLPEHYSARMCPLNVLGSRAVKKLGHN